MDDIERQIAEIRKTVLNLCNAATESSENDKRLMAEIEEIKKRLTDIETFLSEQNGKKK